MAHGIQIVSLAIVATILLNIFTNRRLPLLTTKLFSMFVLTVFGSVTLEYFTYVMISQLSDDIYSLCVFAHRIMILFMVCAANILFLYVDSKSHNQRRHNFKEHITHIAPTFVALFGVMFLPIHFNTTPGEIYSYGPMVYMGFVCVSVSFMFILYKIIFRRSSYTRRERRTIGMGLGVWLTVVIVQLMFPYMLVSSMGFAFVALFVYMSIEDTRLFVDFECQKLLNLHAYDVVLENYFGKGKTFYVACVSVTNIVAFEELYGKKAINDIFKSLVLEIKKNNYLRLYRSEHNSISAIFSSKEEYAEFAQKIFAQIEKISKNSETDFIEWRVSGVEYPEHVSSRQGLDRIFEYVNGKDFDGQKEYENRFIEVDDSVIEQVKYSDAVEKLVRNALRNDGFDVYYQPIYSNEKGRFSTCEALVRLKDNKTLGFISPEIFIPIAERNNLIAKLGEIVLNKVCKFVTESKLLEKGIDYIEVNLSGKQIIDVRFPSTLMGILDNHSLNPEVLNLELTETASTTDADILNKNMLELQGKGFCFSMDDFGTGYSNLSKIAESSFDIIKLDKSLVWSYFGEDASENTKVILDACIEMVLNINKSIVAEGVETKEQADILSQKGVNYLQGYFFSRPIPENEFLAFIENANF